MEVGLHEGDLDEERRLLAAQLCIEASADTTQIPRWIEEGDAEPATSRRLADVLKAVTYGSRFGVAIAA